LYALFDLGNAIDRKADATRIALQVAQLMERNVERFQDELQHVLTCGPKSWRTRLHGDRTAS